jgi:SAM-dependent methyltransferase
MSVNKIFESELQYWDLQLSGKGDASDEISSRILPYRMYEKFPLFIIPFIERRRTETKKIPVVFDVGSGPDSQLAYAHERKLIKLCCVDPLAEEYKSLLKKYNFPPIKYKMSSSPGENLSLPDNYIDLVWVHNSLDHMQNPIKAWEEMIKKLAPGGFLIIQGWENEGKNQGYFELHKHDLYWKSSDKIICLKTRGDDTEYIFDSSSLILWDLFFPKYGDKTWMKIIYQKKS